MKSRIKYCLMALIVFVCSCKKESSNNALIGKWKLAESYVGTGSGNTDKWMPVDPKSNLDVQFYKDGNLGGNSYPIYKSYSIKDNKIVTFYKPDGTYEDFTYTIANNSLTLSPAGPIFCVEGCAYRYVNVNNSLRQLLP